MSADPGGEQPTTDVKPVGPIRCRPGGEETRAEWRLEAGADSRLSVEQNKPSPTANREEG